MIQDSDANFNNKLTPVLTPLFIVIDSCYQMYPPSVTRHVSHVTEVIELSTPRHVLGTFCSSTSPPPPPISSSSHEVRCQLCLWKLQLYLIKVELRFTSDESSADTGFLVTWAEKPGCGRLLTEVSIECFGSWFEQIKYWMITAELRNSCFTT